MNDARIVTETALLEKSISFLEPSSSAYGYTPEGNKTWNDPSGRPFLPNNPLPFWIDRATFFREYSNFVEAGEGKISQAVVNAPLNEGEWSVRTVNAFEAAGLTTFRELAQWSLYGLQGWDNFGPISLEEVRQVLGGAGIRLYGDDAASPFLHSIPTEPDLPLRAVLPKKYWTIFETAGITTYDMLRKLTREDFFAIPGIKASHFRFIAAAIAERETHRVPNPLVAAA